MHWEEFMVDGFQIYSYAAWCAGVEILDYRVMLR